MVKKISLAKENTKDVSLDKLFGLLFFFKVNKSLNEGKCNSHCEGKAISYWSPISRL